MKGTIKSAVATGREYMNLPEYLVIFEDGKEALSFSGKFCQNEGNEVEYTEQTDKAGNLRVYWPKDPSYDNKGSRGASNGSSGSNDSYYRCNALNNAVEWHKAEGTFDNVKDTFDMLLNILENK